MTIAMFTLESRFVKSVFDMASAWFRFSSSSFNVVSSSFVD